MFLIFGFVVQTLLSIGDTIHSYTFLCSLYFLTKVVYVFVQIRLLSAISSLFLVKRYSLKLLTNSFHKILQKCLMYVNNNAGYFCRCFCMSIAVSLPLEDKGHMNLPTKWT